MDANHGLEQAIKALRCLQWLPSYAWQQIVRTPIRGRISHVLLSVADHFEPSFLPEQPSQFASRDEQERRLEHWCHAYPAAMESARDSDGFPLRRTYFYPAEQYDPVIIDRLAAHCRDGWGEIEIHLHHGIGTPDSASNTRRVLSAFRDELGRRGCLASWQEAGPPAYAFVHGNWALANSAGGRFCGVDDELQILAETGCYADFTLPSAPDPAQVATINALYECALPLSRRAAHRRGRALRVGCAPRDFPLMMQGPLAIRFGPRWRPRIENGELTASNPATLDRFRLWVRAAISIRGRPEWSFIKLHCHGMDPRDQEAHLGQPMREFLAQLLHWARLTGAKIHFVTAREMVNIALAACDGRDGAPGVYRNYRLRSLREATGRRAADPAPLTQPRPATR